MIKGSIVALVSPMFEDGTIDYDSYRNLIEMHIAAGTNAIVAVGTTGESPTVDYDEHNELVRVADVYKRQVHRSRRPCYRGDNRQPHTGAEPAFL